MHISTAHRPRGSKDIGRACAALQAALALGDGAAAAAARRAAEAQAAWDALCHCGYVKNILEDALCFLRFAVPGV